ncbi:lipid-A-disaccharide synthase [Ornithobacterium rhinotracheale]|uniref:lipid-A-disaccharide synthase n=1 Tax=Ornithobacterium rhinotracheale TaxID=28251 RepID=UPI004036DAA6
MKYYIIAGEASGDLHAANLIKEIKKRDPNAEFRAWGGDLMQAQGASLVKHYRDLAFMGFVEVVMNLKTILMNIKFCKEDIKAWQPDELILVDYPGFNLKIAPFAKKLGIKVIYYISPQVWAWKSSRVHAIKKYVDKMLVILPFEKDFYRKYDYSVDFVGHPLLDAIAQREVSDEQSFRQKWGLDDRKIIALLPGSRKQEIKTKLPIMLSVVKDFPEYQFVVAGAPSQERALYEPYLTESVKWVENQTYALLQHSYAALVTSGTATLETALLGVPEVVCYKGSRISYEIGKRLVKNIEYISLVNLIMNREVVKELIQQDLNYKNLKTELTKILGGASRAKMLEDYQKLREVLGGAGASARAAEIIVGEK